MGESGAGESGSGSSISGFDAQLNKGASDNKVYFGIKNGEAHAAKGNKLCLTSSSYYSYTAIDGNAYACAFNGKTIVHLDPKLHLSGFAADRNFKSCLPASFIPL